MTDNRTTELREKLDNLIIELDRLDITLDSPASDMTIGEYEQEREKLLDGFIQAIAATMGSDRHPYEQRITGDGSDWGEIMRDAYDDLMASACESCTPEQMEQLVDYIRAELGSGTCHAIAIYNMNDEWCGDKCSACDYEWYEDEPNFCPNCGRKVVSA